MEDLSFCIARSVRFDLLPTKQDLSYQTGVEAECQVETYRCWAQMSRYISDLSLVLSTTDLKRTARRGPSVGRPEGSLTSYILRFSISTAGKAQANDVSPGERGAAVKKASLFPQWSCSASNGVE